MGSFASVSSVLGSFAGGGGLTEGFAEIRGSPKC